MRLRTAAVIALAVAAAGLFSLWPSSGTLVVRPGESLQRALDGAPRGATVVVERGTYRGPVVVDRPVRLEAESGAHVVAPSSAAAVVTITAPDVLVEGLAVEGGSSGVVVRSVEGVSLTELAVSGSELHGVEIVDASAALSGVTVTELGSRFAQGIEVRNSDGRPDTVVMGSSVTGGQEGIVAHVSEVLFENNTVIGTSMRALVVTEMSDGVVRGNRVNDARGVGLYCGDMSRCVFSGNHGEPVSAGAGGRSSAGWGMVVNFHAVATNEDNELEGSAGRAAALLGSRIVRDSPLELGSTKTGLLNAGAAALASMLVLGIAMVLSRRFVASRLHPRTKGLGPQRSGPLSMVLVAGLGVQSFHMAEHFLQVYRVHLDGIPSRGGIVGPAVEAEWIHFGYNALVLASIAGLALLRRSGWRPTRLGGGADMWLGAALLLQGYHVVEHSIKLIQHLSTGRKVNPGLLGGEIDLVWLHFSLNLAVYAAFMVACILYAPRIGDVAARLKLVRRHSHDTPDLYIGKSSTQSFRAQGPHF